MLKSNRLNIQKKGDLIYITFPALELDSVTAAHSTRMGGFSRGRYAQMNFGTQNGDDPEAVMKNYQTLFGALGLDESRAVLSKQTHTDNLRIVTEQDLGKGLTRPLDYDDVDGLITNLSGVPLVTQFADCVPLLFFDPVKKVAAASHAGWRGTVKQIGLKTVQTMQTAFGCNPADIHAGIGPSIGPCCYEVDTPVYRAIADIEYLNPEELLTPVSPEHWMLNLQLANLKILLHAGLLEQNISVSDICTCCNANYLHSHRATGGNRGNNCAVIAIKP